jgi:chromosome segregation protein
MYLKSVEIHGFKSFAQKTVLDFPNGNNGRHTITAIVGPNGSGKSNVADAVRWVMGEQSIKAIRGKKGEDIIFTGSESKGQMGMASVTLTLDNSDKRVDIDFDELVITRRYYRSGDSDYIINGKNVRLLDLQLLLAKAQFGQGSYSVIGQGMIDRLLLQSPQERKDFFDEASGIKEFQIKRHQAALKLRRTKENIDQADLLLNEVAPRLRSLSRQVKKLEKRKDVELQLREAQEQYYCTLYNYNQTNLNDLTRDLVEVNKEYNEVNEKLTSVQKELAELAREESRQQQFENLQREYQEVLRKKNSLESARAVLQGKLQTEYSKAGKQNIGWLESKIEEFKNDQAKVDKELSEAENLMDKTGDEILSQKQRLEHLSVERTEIRGKIAGLEQRMVQTKSEQNYLQYSGLKAVQAVLEERHRLGNIYGTVAQLGEVDEKYRLALDVAAGGHLASIVVDNGKTAQTCIQYLREHHLGVATFLPLDKIKPRFLPSNIQELIEREGVHGLATDLVKYGDKFSDIFSYALGSTLIVDNIDVAREIGLGKVRMVTLDGDVLDTSGSMKGGFRQKDKRKGMSFSHGDSPYLVQGEMMDFEEEISGLQNKLNKSEIEYEKFQENLHELQSQAHIAGSNAQMFGTQKQDIDRELSSMEHELSLYTMSPEEITVSMKDVQKEKNNLDREVKNLEKELKDVEDRIEEFNSGEEKKKKRIFALQEVMQEEQQKLNKIVDTRNEKRVTVAKLETKQEDLANDVYQELHTSLQSVLGREPKLVEVDKLEEVQQNIQKLKYSLSLIGGIDEEVVEEYEETKERHDGLVEQLDDLKKATEDLESMVADLDVVMKKKRDKAFKQIKKEFSRYFSLLFDGGKAELSEIYGDMKDEEVDPAEEIEGVEGEELEVEEGVEEKKRTRKKKVLLGIDVTACPPGKRIKNIAALSGGERTMTSIALVCAILHTNPSPFVVLDEVEAALDEANTLRFTKILQELADQSQFILITHNRATMHSADALYGVTMGNDGISHLLSVDMQEAEKVSE